MGVMWREKNIFYFFSKCIFRLKVRGILKGGKVFGCGLGKFPDEIILAK